MSHSHELADRGNVHSEPPFLGSWSAAMRDVGDVLKERELMLETVRREVEALRLVAPLLADESDRNGFPEPDEIVWKDVTTGQAVKGWP